MLSSVKKLLPAPARSLLRKLRGRSNPSACATKLKSFHRSKQEELSSVELLAFARHDAHRIEKAFYNQIFVPKRTYYEQRQANILRAAEILKSRGFDPKEPTLEWAVHIAETFEELPEKFIEPLSTEAQPVDPSASDSLLSLIATRRSSRVWSRQQPSRESLSDFACRMIDAARWAPNSGDRQPWRFRIITDDEEKLFLKGLKEEHCYSAPCLIFIGADRRVYGALGQNEAGIYIDAGAAVMLMVLTAHAAHFGVCWNHLSSDLIESRTQNSAIYRSFTQSVGIPDYIEPIAIVAFGAAEFHPPAPPRMEVQSLLL